MIEVVTSLAITSILMLAIGSAMVLAGRALPSADGVAASTLTAANAVDKMAAELRFALQITERTDKSIRFTVPDRDGDGKVEIIRYAWSGVGKAPLTRQYNSTSAVTLLEGVTSLEFVFEEQLVAEVYPGPIIEENETLLASHNPNNYVSAEHILNAGKGIGQFIKPELPADTYTWRLTRFLFRAKRDNALLPLGTVGLRLHLAGNDKTPSGGALASGTMSESSLSTSFNWVQINVNTAINLKPEQQLCFLTDNAAGLGKAGRIEYASNNGVGMLLQGDGGYGYVANRATRHQAYGRVSKVSRRTVNRTHITAVRIALQTTGEAHGRIETAVRLPNQPEALAAQWETDFSSNPTTADQNVDGLPDWSSATGFDTGRLSNGVWRADRTLRSNPANGFHHFTTVEVAMRDTTAGGGGAGIEMRVEASALGHGIIEAYVARQNNNTQTLTLQTRDLLLLPKTLFTLPDLPTGMVQLKLYINPADDSVGVVANGVFHGSYNYNRSIDLSDGMIRIFNTLLENGAEFDRVKVRVGGAP